MGKGIIVATNKDQEWLLPWWWHHYNQFNALPVCFFDLGMTLDAQKWCSQRGILIQEPQNKSHPWFQKPICCQKSPFETTLWIDLDCQVLAPLDEAFSHIDTPAGLSVAYEEFSLPGVPYPTFNSGVIAFHKNSPTIAEWSLISLHLSHLYPGDQDLLSAVLHRKSLWMCPLPPIFNWSHQKGASPDAKIIHWHGPAGKAAIRTQSLKNRQ